MPAAPLVRGQWACAQVEDVLFWAKNWRKGGLQERRNSIIKEQNFSLIPAI